MATKSKTNNDVIYFQLGDRRSIWGSRNGKVYLSIFANEDGKSITKGVVDKKKDPSTYAQVMTAISIGALVQIAKPKSYTENIEVKVINTGESAKKEEANKKAEEILNLTATAQRVAIINTKDKETLAAMLALESAGRNKAHRKRKNIIELLRAKLEEIDGTGSVEYTETYDESEDEKEQDIE